MKLAVCARGEGLNAEVDFRFGRCSFFVIVDSENGTLIDSIPNSAAEAAGGAGPQSAQLLANNGVEAVALGKVGPNAAAALEAAKIKVFLGVQGTVVETMQKFRNKELSPVSGATAPSHAGMKGKK